MSKQARGIKTDLWQTNSGLRHIEWAPSECIKEEEQEIYYCLVKGTERYDPVAEL